MNNPTCTYTGFGSSITSFICNATSGNLSQAQVNDQKAAVSAAIAQAAAGRQPGVVAELQAQAQAEIDKVLSNFALPGETGSDVGALPSQSGLRVPGTGNITLDKLQQIFPKLPNLTNVKWWILAFILVAGTAYALPYAAPVVRKAVKAAKG